MSEPMTNWNVTDCHHNGNKETPMTATPPSTFNPTSDGYDFATDTHVTVLRGVTIGSGQDIGIYGGLALDVLLNKGRIHSDHSDGVAIISASISQVTNAQITNALGAVISGAIGAYLETDGPGGSVTFNNSGIVSGTTGEGLYFNSVSPVLVNNHGSVTGAQDGILLAVAAGGTINNHGAIKGGEIGIEIDQFGSIGSTTIIKNSAGAIIKGPNDAIDQELNSTGNFRLMNHGTVTGNVEDGNNARDVIINTGRINGHVELGSGNSYFNGTGGTSGAIVADGGNDRIIAGKGNLLIELGGGSSTLTSGPGHDRFFFDAPLANQVDKITNFKHGQDKIILSAADFAGVGPVGGTLAAADFHVGTHAATASQYIIYDAADGFVFYDPHDGSPQDHFATLSPHLALTHSDFLVAA
jgi:Ca2+-binding RTX toxin-like protein